MQIGHFGRVWLKTEPLDFLKQRTVNYLNLIIGSELKISRCQNGPAKWILIHDHKKPLNKAKPFFLQVSYAPVWVKIILCQHFASPAQFYGHRNISFITCVSLALLIDMNDTKSVSCVLELAFKTPSKIRRVIKPRRQSLVERWTRPGTRNGAQIDRKVCQIAVHESLKILNLEWFCSRFAFVQKSSQCGSNETISALFRAFLYIQVVCYSVCWFISVLQQLLVERLRQAPTKNANFNFNWLLVSM